MSSDRLVPAEVIAVKRDGDDLEPDQLRGFLTGYLDGAVAEEQMSAFLMAGVINVLLKPDEPSRCMGLVETVRYSRDVAKI